MLFFDMGPRTVRMGGADDDGDVPLLRGHLLETRSFATVEQQPMSLSSRRSDALVVLASAVVRV